jgi:hypothetical protein
VLVFDTTHVTTLNYVIFLNYYQFRHVILRSMSDVSVRASLSSYHLSQTVFM